MISLSGFFGGLKIAGVSFYLPGVRQYSRTAGGEILSAVMGASLWRGEITLTAGRNIDLNRVQAQLEYIDQLAETFLIHPHPIWAPQSDPDGSIISAYAPLIYALPSDASKIRLEGMPEGYTLKRGDFLSFQYGSDPTRYALHRIYSSSVSADPAGVTPQITVVPHIRPGATVGAAVMLYKPVCKAMIVPGSVKWSSYSRLYGSGASLEFIQTLR